MYNQDIVQKVMTGDLDAFSKMYNDCAPAVYRRAYSLLEDPVLAREAVRNVFRDIRKHIKDLSDPRDFDEWVFRLVNMHVNQTKSSRQQLWDEPDLRGVWDEINAEDNGAKPPQTPESIIETLSRMRQQEERRPNAAPAPPEDPAAAPDKNAPRKDLHFPEGDKAAPYYDDLPPFPSQREEGGEEEWEPILFPPEEGGGKGAASLPLDGMPPGTYASVPAQTPQPSATGGQPPPVDAPYPEETQQEDVLLPLDASAPSQKKGGGNRKRKRIRYEAARASTHFSVERVPYDYIPYEETSQEAYDKVTLDEVPRAVYEHIPYERPAKEDMVDAEPTISYTTIPYQGVQQAAAATVEPVAVETKTEPTTAVEEPAPDVSAAAPIAPLAPEYAETAAPSPSPATEEDGMEQEWQDVDPGKIDVDEVLQEIVAEVDGVHLEQRGGSIIQMETESSSAGTALPLQTPSETISPPPPQEQTEQVIPAIESAPPPEQKAVEAEQARETGETEPTEQPSPLPEDASPVEPQKKKRSWIAGAGFFVGAVAVLIIILVAGHSLGLW